MNRPHSRVIVAQLLLLLLFGTSFFPLSHAVAYEIPQGCRAATQADIKARQDRGITPADQPVCPGDVAYLGIGKSFDEWYAQLKSQSPCNRSTCALACRTRNTGAQICGTTSRKWSAIGCHPNNNTAIFPTASHGFAAHIELLKRFCSERGRCTIARVVGQWTATVGDRNAYAAFVSRNSGIPSNQVFNPNDTDLVGRMAMAMACFEGGALPYSLDELKRGLVMAGGGAAVPVPQNVGQLLDESLHGSYAPSPRIPLNSPMGGGAFPANGLTGFPSNTGGFSQGSSLGSGYATPHDDNQTTNFQNNDNPILGAPAVSHVIVWPKNIAPGGTLKVIWTSVNMKKDSCKVTLNSNGFAEGAEGSQIYRTTSVDSGTMTFVLKCRDAEGNAKEVQGSAIIQ